MNELLFGLQVLFVFGFTGFLVRFGKETMAAWMGVLAILVNLFVTKEIHLFGLDVTSSEVFAVGIFLTLNIIQEFWGKEEASRGIKLTLLFQMFFLVLSQVHLLYIPNVFDTRHEAFEQILGVYPRLLTASFITLWLVQKWDLWFFILLKSRCASLSFTIRNILCLMASQLLDTISFTVLGLWGVIGSVGDVIVMSFLVKCILIFITPVLTLSLKRYAIPL